MSKKTTVGADSSAPTIAFEAALRARFLWADREYTVGDCALSILRAFLSHHLEHRHYMLEEVLSCLADGDDALARWAACEMALSVSSATIPFHLVEGAP